MSEQLPPRAVEDPSALAGIWEISVKIRRGARNSHIALILGAMSA
jgi:hypothetical protein